MRRDENEGKIVSKTFIMIALTMDLHLARGWLGRKFVRRENVLLSRQNRFGRWDFGTHPGCIYTQFPRCPPATEEKSVIMVLEYVSIRVDTSHL